jgi:ring-1,2-phenylacetyl-CoA epoxidase subunit PaaC
VNENYSPEVAADLFSYLCQLGDDRLVLGHRLSEWCGHAHDLEDDIALANVALDMIGQTEFFLRAAGEIEGKGRDENALAYLRDALDFQNCQLVELPRGDFGFTICRAVAFDLYSERLFSALLKSTDEQLAGLAGRCLKEVRYHIRYSTGWFVRLGDGTEESKARMQTHLNTLWGYCGELFQDRPEHLRLAEKDIIPLPSTLQAGWLEQFASLAQKTTLEIPETSLNVHSGGRGGFHTEHLGHLLSEMQILPRSYPEAIW